MDEDRKAFETYCAAEEHRTGNAGRLADSSSLWRFWQATIAYERERAARVCDEIAAAVNADRGNVAILCASQIRKGPQ